MNGEGILYQSLVRMYQLLTCLHQNQSTYKEICDFKNERKCGSQKYVEQGYSGHLKVLETNFFVNSWPDTIHMFAIIKNTNALSTLRFGGISIACFY